MLIRDAVLHARVRTVAFVDQRAISAGALIALAAETIVMADGGTIGAATPVEIGLPGAPAQPVAEKTVSYMRKEFGATAESRKRPPLLAEAMVDADVEIPGIVAKGKLLTLTTEEAVEHGLADLRETTGDETILSEEVPFLTGASLPPGEVERYARFEPGDRRATLYRHCLAAIERGRTAGAHGLPLFGSGDWNDGMNRVGGGGRGESVWLGWFLHATLTRFAGMSERMADTVSAEALRRQADGLHAAFEVAWDGAWYRRGYYDDGTPLGSSESAECRIDSVAQSWAVLSSAADRPRAAAAMEAVLRHLVNEDEGLILLLTPPFAGATQDPATSAPTRPASVRTGGQYTHAAIWVLWALVDLGEVDRAVGLLQRLLPIRHALAPEAVARYRTEPYALAADVYAAPPWTGRGGWTWYTGAAGWAYRLGLEAILGLRRCGGAWSVDPRIPASWPGFELVVRDGATVVHVLVENPRGVNRGIVHALLDGQPFDPPLVPHVRDGRTHEVRLTLG